MKLNVINCELVIQNKGDDDCFITRVDLNETLTTKLNPDDKVLIDDYSGEVSIQPDNCCVEVATKKLNY